MKHALIILVMLMGCTDNTKPASSVSEAIPQFSGNGKNWTVTNIQECPVSVVFQKSIFKAIPRYHVVYEADSVEWSQQLYASDTVMVETMYPQVSVESCLYDTVMHFSISDASISFLQEYDKVKYKNKLFEHGQLYHDSSWIYGVKFFPVEVK